MRQASRFAIAWCSACKLVVQAAYVGRKPVGVECPKCQTFRYVCTTTKYPIAADAQGDPLYLDPEEIQ
jgi:hypothetical protein